MANWTEEQHNSLQEGIRKLESRFVRDIDVASDELFDGVVRDAVDFTESAFGVLFEVQTGERGSASLRPMSTYPDCASSSFYQESKAESFRGFYNQPSLFSDALVGGKTVFFDAREHNREEYRFPKGHLEVKTCFIEPFYFGGKLLGMLALMNCPRGYNQQVKQNLSVLNKACASILFAMRNNQRRMHAEEQLQDSVSRISAIVDTVVDGILTINENGIIESFNPAAEKIFGYVAHEVIGRNVSLLMPGRYHDEHDKYLNNYLSTGTKKVIGIGREVVGRRRDGSNFPLELSVNEMKLGEQRMFTGVVRDITERKRDEEQLRDSVARISTIVETVVDGIIILDDQGVIESFNPAAEHIFGYSVDEVLGRNVRMLMPDPYHEEHDSYLRNYHRTGEKKVIGAGREVEGRKKDGSTFPLELSVSEMWLGDERKFTGIVRDVTERKSAEGQLHDSAARIGAILDTVVDGILTINELGEIETVNPAATRIFGYESKEMVGRNVSMLMPEPFHDEHDRYLDNYMRTGNRKVIGIGREVVGLRKDGSTFPLELSVSEMQVGNKRMFTGIVRDITERKNVETLKNEFISTVSHELRTPLTSIKGSLGLILSGAIVEVPTKAQELLKIAEKNASRLISLINDILDIEKIAAGKMQFNMKSHALMPLIEQAVEANEAYASQYDVQYFINHGSSQDDVYVNVDGDRIIQVLANLLSNAAKFSPPNSRVEIALECQNEHVRVSVSDQGEGIPEDFQEHIFAKFSQADASDKRKKQGTGLGLAISKEIIEKMSGQIGFESQPGQGATFFFMLPVAYVRRQTELDQIKGEVLLFATSEGQETALDGALLQVGYKQYRVDTLDSAKSLIKDQGFLAVLVDLQENSQDGLAFIYQLRQELDFRELPLVVRIGTEVLENDTMSIEGLPNSYTVGASAGDGEFVDIVQKAIRMRQGFRPHILHVEDDSDVSKVVTEICQDMADFDYASTVKIAREKLTQHHYDLVILDLELPGGSGWELLTHIKSQVPSPPIVVLAAKEPGNENADQVEAILIKSQISNQQILETLQKLIPMDESV